ncbi:hypothetical protein EVAR_11186_1 [Eumeta japonica]|uniref:Uncharacterized protein n=1 Tax=Eumeta variegata TaxID=151549 RepID=A0A4C1U440_EUMVA|nr:hypothetical protein EVAR_11186_1 [Eumeta japonica]
MTTGGSGRALCPPEGGGATYAPEMEAGRACSQAQRRQADGTSCYTITAKRNKGKRPTSTRGTDEIVNTARRNWPSKAKNKEVWHALEDAFAQRGSAQIM